MEIKIDPKNAYCLTNKKTLCRRGVMWLGQTCNLRCRFCYFANRVSDREHPEHAFMSLDKAKNICKTMVEVYGNNAVDIQGGEPTIYKPIFDLIKYCNLIGLKPTLITNGQALADKAFCKKFKESGVYDFLISLHGTKHDYDDVVRVKGAYDRILQCIKNCQELSIPFRLNCVLCNETLSHLMEVADLAIQYGARAVNFIAYNPFVDQCDSREQNIIPRYADVAKAIMPVIDILDAKNIEINLRYLPFCIFPEKYRKYIQDFQQTVYDLHEWENASESWIAKPNQRVAAMELSTPVHFYQRIECLRMVHFPKIHVNDQKSLLLEALFAKLDGIKKRLGRDPNVYIFGTTPVAQFLAEMLRESKRFLIKAFLTTREKQTARTLNGMPWVTLEDLNPLEVDAVVNTSIGSQDYINELLKANSFGEIICFLDDTSLEIDDVFQKKFYLPELGPVESFSELEYAYKEHRILMTKSHPYSKGEKCSECDLMSICDGFHKDYAKFFGFDEATSIRLPSKTYDPRYYSCQQRKVVEEQEYAWIFTDAEREQLCADTPR